MRLRFGIRTGLGSASTVALAALLIAAAPAGDLDRLQGTWKLIDNHWGGVSHKDSTGTWVIKGESLTRTVASAYRGTISLDMTTTPGRFEKTDFDHPKATKKGMFRLEGDALKFYFPMFNDRNEPPIDLPDEPARGYILELWQRVGARGLPGLDGNWKRVGWYLRDNQFMPLDECEMMIRGTVWASVTERRRRCTIKVGASQNPKQLDLTSGDDDEPLGKHTEPWVYRLDGDRLTVWESFRGRPTEASDAADSKQHFQVFERVKP